jgi:hypothetical protein
MTSKKVKGHGFPNVRLLDSVAVGSSFCIVNGRVHQAEVGNWAFYVPALQLKLLHSVDGLVHCIRDSAPTRDEAFSEAWRLNSETYTTQDWRAAFSKHTVTRAAENYLVALRLYEAGVGPEPLALCLVSDFTSVYNLHGGTTAGFYVRNINHLPPKDSTTLEEIVACGVIPDRIKSCVRQQIRGYVSDLNSVVGALPTGRDTEIKAMVEHVWQQYRQDRESRNPDLV